MSPYTTPSAVRDRMASRFPTGLAGGWPWLSCWSDSLPGAPDWPVLGSPLGVASRTATLVLDGAGGVCASFGRIEEEQQVVTAREREMDPVANVAA